MNLGFVGDNQWGVSEALLVDNHSLSGPPAAKRRRVETEGAPVEKVSEQEVADELEVPLAPEVPVPVEPLVLAHNQIIVRSEVHVPREPEVAVVKGHVGEGHPSANVDNDSGDHPDNPIDNSVDAGNVDNMSTASFFTANKPVMLWTVGAKAKLQELGLYARFEEGTEGPIFDEFRETLKMRVNGEAKAKQILRKVSSMCHYVQRHCDLPVDSGFDPACLEKMSTWTELFTLLLQGGCVTPATALMYFDAIKKFFKWSWFENDKHKAAVAHLITKVDAFHTRGCSDSHERKAERNAMLLKTGDTEKSGEELRKLCKMFRDKNVKCRQIIDKYKLPVLAGALPDDINVPRSDVNFVARHLMCILVYLHNHMPSVAQNLTVADVLAISEIPDSEFFSMTVGKHKTSKTHTGAILLNEQEKEFFMDFLFYIRTRGDNASEAQKTNLFLNAEGNPFTSIGKEVDRHCALEGLPRVTATNVRKMMATESAKHGTLEYMAKYLCHTEKVAQSEYVRPDWQDHIRARKAMEFYQKGVPADEPQAKLTSSYVPEEAVQKFLEQVVFPEFPLSIGTCPKDFVRDNMKDFSQANDWKAFMKGKDPARAVQDRYRIRFYETKALTELTKFLKRPTIEQAKALITKNGWNKVKPRRVCELWTEPR